MQKNYQASSSIYTTTYSKLNDISSITEVDRTAISSEKLSFLMNDNKFSNEESRYVMPSKMPKELRNDADIEAKLEELEKASKIYMAFDM